MTNPNFARAVELLSACRELLEKADRSPYVLDVMSETAFYDGADCDGLCLKEDIEHFLAYEVQP